MVILEIVQSLFASAWSLFDLTFPGLDVSFGTVFLAFLIARLSISLFHHASGSGSGGSDYRSGSAQNPKISENRKDDAF